TAHMGGVCTLVNASCCTYIDESNKIETDIQTIWTHAKILHSVTSDNTSFGLSNLWDTLTSWLPNLIWLKHLFIASLMITVIALLVYCFSRCFFCMFRDTHSSYADWKKYTLREKIQNGQYFMESH
ncbi:ERVV2 protein, partial [Galbula dea]|nr:ERVV2 protein [Galbula dea]